MPVTAMKNLPDDAHVWIFGASSALNPEQSEVLLRAVEEFQRNWAAHGAPLTTAGDLRDQRFLVVAVEPSVDPSGCSIDRLFKLLQSLSGELGISLVDSGSIFYRDDRGEVQAATRDEFRNLAQRGAVTGESIVFDNAVQTLGDLRHGRWERPASQSWHGRLMAPAGAFVST
ncbi:MAG: hypothetical protein ABI718_00480 [Acidobacteriota bacterium]